MEASNFRNIRFETELLESLDWDGGKLLELYNYIEEATAVENPNSMHMLGIIKHVSENYSKKTASLVKQLFIESEKEINKNGNPKS